jgi:hypothetical protein
VLARAQELGLEVKTASSGLDEEGAALVRLSYDDTAKANIEPTDTDDRRPTTIPLKSLSSRQTSLTTSNRTFLRTMRLQTSATTVTPEKAMTTRRRCSLSSLGSPSTTLLD